jgi:hypothetical protein
MRSLRPRTAVLFALLVALIAAQERLSEEVRDRLARGGGEANVYGIGYDDADDPLADEPAVIRTLGFVRDLDVRFRHRSGRHAHTLAELVPLGLDPDVARAQHGGALWRGYHFGPLETPFGLVATPARPHGLTISIDAAGSIAFARGSW